MTLEALGWNEQFKKAFAPFEKGEFAAGRVAVQHKTHYLLYTEFGELRGEITGKMHYLAEGLQDFPAVGDWVVIHARPHEQAATIHELLPRKSSFSRKVAGVKVEEQVLAANVDVVFLVSGLDGDFNLRRLERYLVLAAESGAMPVVILNKTDLCEDLNSKEQEIRSVASDVPLYFLSAAQDKGLDKILSYLKPGVTGALLGSSGVGKTTIINHLLGAEVYPTLEVREGDSRGRHATTRRELIILPGGGLLIDTPGMRELQLWGGTSGVVEIFGDISDLAKQCRFRDCAHETEPGCAIQKALEEGKLEESRYRSFQKLRREIAYQNRRIDKGEQRTEKERIKRISREIKQIFKTRKKGRI
jgi:ribosome biogenesis GTPase